MSQRRHGVGFESPAPRSNPAPVPDIDLGHAVKLPPRAAIAYFNRKGYKTSWNWWEVWQEAHARAFTVAKAVKLDVLESIRGSLDEALRKGMTRREWAKNIEPELRKLGWWGRQFVAGPGGVERVQLGSPWRLRTIFDTNMRVTAAAARGQAQLADTDSRPFWMYSSRQDSRVRPGHAALDGAVFRSDDPIWQTHYPPNGWKCRCRVRALTARQVSARGARVLDSRTDGELREVMQKVGLDKRTGEEIERPGTAFTWRDDSGQSHTLLPDPGWSYNPGKTGQGRLPVPPAPARRPRRPATGPDARRDLAEATAAVERRLNDRRRRAGGLSADINDPDAPTGHGELAARAELWRDITADKREIRVIALRLIQRDRPAAWRGDGEAAWADDELRQEWGTELETWRRMVSPELLGRVRPPRIASGGEGSSAGYWDRSVTMASDAPPGTIIHEASHLLEGDEATFRRTVEFLGRRTRGDVIEVINTRGDIGRRDRWRSPSGDDDFYPGRLYPSGTRPHGGLVHDARLEGAPGEPAIEPVREGQTGPVDIYGTEVLSQGMQWLWEDPAGFAREDPEYFDFIWETVIGQ